MIKALQVITETPRFTLKLFSFPVLYSRFLLSVLYMVVCICQSQSPNLSLPHSFRKSWKVASIQVLMFVKQSFSLNTTGLKHHISSQCVFDFPEFYYEQFYFDVYSVLILLGKFNSLSVQGLQSQYFRKLGHSVSFLKQNICIKEITVILDLGRCVNNLQKIFELIYIYSSNYTHTYTHTLDFLPQETRQQMVSAFLNS